jgi:NhaP-type Na+/H+ or K+/H+ antiporter
MDEHTFVIYLGAIGLVILISGLVSGIVERGPLSQVLVFVALGAVVGPWGFDAINFGIDSPAIEAVGTISLVLVFFTDAIKINLGQLRQNWILPALALGPGAIITVVLIGVASKLLLDLSWSVAFLIAAALASTDAVLLRDVLTNRKVPRAVRNTLSIEAGANDVIILPLLLILATVVAGHSKSTGDWITFGFDLYILGPLAGIIVAYVAIKAMSYMRQRLLVRRDYESLYSIGVAFVAYAVAEQLNGSGLLAAFAAGLTIAIIDDELCDCFLEYGETTSEMAMLLTFVFLGASLVDSAWNELTFATVALALFTLFIARPVAFAITLARANISNSGTAMIAWFGPRGLNTLLLIILVIAEGIPDAGHIFGIISVVVMASIIIHGISATPLINWYHHRQESASLPEEILVDAADLLKLSDRPEHLAEPKRITPADLAAMMADPRGVTIVDVRRQVAMGQDDTLIPGSFHVSLDELLDRLDEIPRDKPVVLTCTCPAEESSSRGALMLRDEGYTDVSVLLGGSKAWFAYAGQPIQLMPRVATAG